MTRIKLQPSCRTVSTTLHRQVVAHWFSAGQPSSLVRDNGVESKDPPPSEPFKGPLVLAANGPGTNANGDDLRRVGDRQGDSYEAGKAFEAAVDASTWFPIT